MLIKARAMERLPYSDDHFLTRSNFYDYHSLHESADSPSARATAIPAHLGQSFIMCF